MQSIKMAALYSFGCRRTKDLKADKILEKFILSKKTEDAGVLEILKILQPYADYLKLARICEGKNPFSGEIIRTYWLGGKLLKKFKDSLPFHNFETLILLVRTKNDEKIMEKILAKAVDCCILPGIVKKISKNRTAIVEYRPIDYKAGKFHFGAPAHKEIKTKFLKDLKVGDLISSHLGYGREKISIQESKSLLFWTKKSLDILNES